MTSLTPFRTYRDPLEAEELIEVLQKHKILFERTFEKSTDPDDYVGSNPFDSDIVISLAKADFSKVNALLKEDSQ